ncbi:hypothetical protein SDC9_188243 [bioreactor metagenome]|uniref:Uncharacterized protein n=1 Tax=bioreactor metagenome TaxID=1076179 RepID=A0A645HWZ0_9ZZZZ
MIDGDAAHHARLKHHRQHAVRRIPAVAETVARRAENRLSGRQRHVVFAAPAVGHPEVLHLFQHQNEAGAGVVERIGPARRPSAEILQAHRLRQRCIHAIKHQVAGSVHENLPMSEMCYKCRLRVIYNIAFIVYNI